jgi:hypothetical protein
MDPVPEPPATGLSAGHSHRRQSGRTGSAAHPPRSRSGCPVVPRAAVPDHCPPMGPGGGTPAPGRPSGLPPAAGLFLWLRAHGTRTS